MYLSECVDMYACMWALVCVVGLQVPMMGKGVVEVLVATLAAVQGEGAPALQVRLLACASLRSMARAADNKV
jgi:hypothetical protein